MFMFIFCRLTRRQSSSSRPSSENKNGNNTSQCAGLHGPSCKIFRRACAVRRRALRGFPALCRLFGHVLSWYSYLSLFHGTHSRRSCASSHPYFQLRTSPPDLLGGRDAGALLGTSPIPSTPTPSSQGIAVNFSDLLE